MQIYQKYMKSESIFQINIPHILLQKIEEKIAQKLFTIDIFDDILQHVIEIMNNDIWPRFLRSKYFTNLIK